MSDFGIFPLGLLKTNFPNKITVSATEPTNPTTSDIWIDSSYVDSSDNTAIGYYKCNETAGTTIADSSANVRHATSSGTTIIDNPVVGWGKAQQGNGSGYILCPAGTTLANLTNWQIECYFTKDALTGDGGYRHIINQYLDTSNAAKGLYFCTYTTNVLYAILRTAPSGYTSLTSAITPAIGTIYKVKLKYDGAFFSMTTYTVNAATGAETFVEYKYSAISGAMNADLRPMTFLCKNDATQTEKGYFTIFRVKITTV